MMSSDYRPIACASHSELEHAVMHNIRLKVVVDGGVRKGIASDIVTKNRAEYLVLTDSAGNDHEYRLDRISEAVSLTDDRQLIG